MKKNSITITYLSKVSFASLNGADKEVDNINPIKKVTLANGKESPYVSSQAIRRALRDSLEQMGHPISVITPGKEKSPPTTEGDPKKYWDDDLFGFMNATGRSQRTSPIRVESLLSISPYKGDLDYGTNFMGVKQKGEPNIFETEIHSGLYRGTILIELDRIGKGQTISQEFNNEDYIDDNEKSKRVLGLLDAFRNLWSSGRQSRFLADISPKFVAAAYMKTKNPIFLEAVTLDENNQVQSGKLKTVVSDYDKYIEEHVFAGQEAIFDKAESVESLKTGFETIEKWVKDYFNQK